MTTGKNDRLKQKALMYVFGKRHRNIVNVDERQDCLYIKCERVDDKGKYYIIEYEKKKLNGIDKDINHALRQLHWIAEGNEFPT